MFYLFLPSLMVSLEKSRAGNSRNDDSRLARATTVSPENIRDYVAQQIQDLRICYGQTAQGAGAHNSRPIWSYFASRADRGL